jgi:hypothetical protein
MKNALSFALVVSAFVAVWAVTPANAFEDTYGYGSAPKDYGRYDMPDGTMYDANNGATYGADRSAPDYDENYRTEYDNQGYAYSFRR